VKRFGAKEQAVRRFLPPRQAQCVPQCMPLGIIDEPMIPASALHAESGTPHERFQQRRLAGAVLSHEERHGRRALER